MNPCKKCVKRRPELASVEAYNAFCRRNYRCANSEYGARIQFMTYSECVSLTCTHFRSRLTFCTSSNIVKSQNFDQFEQQSNIVFTGFEQNLNCTNKYNYFFEDDYGDVTVFPFENDKNLQQLSLRAFLGTNLTPYFLDFRNNFELTLNDGQFIVEFLKQLPLHHYVWKFLNNVIFEYTNQFKICRRLCPICYYEYVYSYTKGFDNVWRYLDGGGDKEEWQVPCTFLCRGTDCIGFLRLKPSGSTIFIEDITHWYTYVRLSLAGDIETNPGPVMSTLNPRYPCDLWRIPEFVKSQMFEDIYNLPANVSTFTKDFSTFVDKLPNKDFFLEAYMSLNDKANHVLNILSETSEKIKASFQIGADMSATLRSVVIGALVLLSFHIMATQWGCTTAIIILISSFLLHYFGITNYLKDFVMDNGASFHAYFKQHYVVNDVVELQSFGNPISNLMVNTENIGGLLAGLFTALFIGSVQLQPSTRDFEDLSRKLFIFQRGATSIFSSFDQLKEFWIFTIEKICAKLQVKTDESAVTKYTILKEVDAWISESKVLFREGFPHTLTMDEKKIKLNRLRTLYNQGLDISTYTNKMTRDKSTIVAFWNNKLSQKMQELSTDALEGELRNPPTTILLYGSSGAGKSSLITALASFTGKLHATLTETPQPSTGSVYVRNCDQAHYDGYTNQFTLVIDDFLSRKDTEANPNLEPNELIKIKNCIPYPLPMAHLPDKGRFLNSEVVIVTTNVKNVTHCLPSMNFPYATANRLSDLSFAVRVKPPYRKYMPPETVAHLISSGLFDQHSVDPERARYHIVPNKIVKPISLDDTQLLNTYTDEQFNLIRGEERRLINGDVQYMNYDLYYFQRLDIKTGNTIGDYLSWSEFLTEVERIYTARIRIGTKILDQTKWTHTTSLAHMKQGIIDVPGFVTSQMNADFMEENFVDASDDEKEFAVRFGRLNYDRLHDPRREEMVFLYNTYMQRWDDYEDLISQRVDEEQQEMDSRWDQIWTTVKERYFSVVQQVKECDVVKILQGAFFVALGAGTIGCFYVAWRDNVAWRKLPHIQKAFHICEETRAQQNAKRNWLQRLFNNSPIVISRREVPLSISDLLILFQNYGYDITQSEAASQNSGSTRNTVRSVQTRGSTNYSAYVPSHSFDMDKVSDLAQDLGLSVDKLEEGFRVNMIEALLPGFYVQLEACQLTDQFLDYVLPANSFMLRIFSNKNKRFYNFGNVFFIEDRKFLMPNHYMMMLKYQLRVGNITESDMVSLSRGPTALERKNNRSANKISCRVEDIMDYAQIIAPAYVDDKTPMHKDAIVVGVKNMSGHSCANMIGKFITRAEYSKLNDPGLSGYLIAQRFTNDGNDSCYCSPIPCVDITPVNKFRYISRDVLGDSAKNDLIGLATAGPESNPVYFQSVIRDRYNYKADTRQGDCGAVLFVESAQLQHPLVGIHVAGDKHKDRANSVPITQEDIREAIDRLGFCHSQGFHQPDLQGLVAEDVEDVVANLPSGDFHYVGRLTGRVPVQPLKSAIRASNAQIHLNVLQDNFLSKRKCKYDLAIKKKPAHLRVNFQNPKDCKIFYGKKGELLYQHDDYVRPLTTSLFNVWLAKGGIFNDVLMKGLEKTSINLPFIDPIKIRMAVNAVKQKFLRRYPNSACPFEKALSQNMDVMSPDTFSVITEFARRRNMILMAVNNSRQREPKKVYEEVLRKVALTKEEHKIFQSNLDADFENFLDCINFDLNLSATNHVEQDFLSYVGNPMILTIEQAVMGIPSDPTISSINSKKSPGYPYSSYGLNFGKKPWVGKECKCDGERWPELQRDVLELLELSKTGIPPIYFVATLKDELRPIEKVDQFKTRVFCAGPMHFTILFRMYFMRFLSFVMENRLYNESALGINPYSTEWEKLADYLSYWDGPFCIAGDYSNFDGSLSNQIMEAILDIVQSFYDRYGATDEERNIRRNLWHCLTRSMIIGRNGCVFRLFNSQPSGNPYTTLINILFNSVVFRMAYYDIFKKREPKKPIRDIYDFEDDVHFISYGDDNVANINPKIFDYFNMETISQTLASYGLTYTDELKNSSFAKGRNLDEINFLKRGFRRVNDYSRRWVAPLDIDTVKEICMWVRKGDEDMQKRILADCVADSLSEMVLHGPRAYNDWCTFVSGFEHKDLLGKDMIVIPDYDTQFIRTCERDLDLDQSF